MWKTLGLLALFPCCTKVQRKYWLKDWRKCFPLLCVAAGAAFVQGRQILDAILMALEKVEDWRTSKKEGFLLKHDLEKAQCKLKI